MVDIWREWQSPIKTVLVSVSFVLAMTGCGGHPRLTVLDPLHIEKEFTGDREKAWQELVKTVIEEGGVVKRTNRAVGRLAFTVKLDKDNFPDLCQSREVGAIKPESFSGGFLEVAIILKQSADGKARLTMDSRCYVVGGLPTFSIFWIPPFFLFAPFAQHSFEPPAAILPSSGNFERELQEKLAPKLGVDLYQWIGESSQ